MQTDAIFHLQMRINDGAKVNIHALQDGNPLLPEFWHNDGATPKPLPGTACLDAPDKWLTIIDRHRGWVTLATCDGFESHADAAASPQCRAMQCFERHRFSTLQVLRAKGIDAELRVVLLRIEEVIHQSGCGRGVRILATH